MVPLNLETPCLSETTEVINEISVKLPSQFLIPKIPASFDDNFNHLTMNNITEVEKFKPERTFEKTINDIKDNHLKSITYIATNLSAINLNKSPSSSEYLKDNLMHLSSMHSKGNTQLKFENVPDLQ